MKKTIIILMILVLTTTALLAQKGDREQEMTGPTWGCETQALAMPSQGCPAYADTCQVAIPCTIT